MISRDEILVHVKNKYNVEPDFPWKRTPNYAVLRHIINRKWFGAIVDITADKLGFDNNKLIDALLLKCDPNLIGSLRCEKAYCLPII